MTRVKAVVDTLYAVLDPGTNAPTPIIPKKRASTRLKNLLKKVKESSRQSAQIQNLLLKSGVVDKDEVLEVESLYKEEEDV